eukprot:814031-Pleurochrysis_carterae.AAC.1
MKWGGRVIGRARADNEQRERAKKGGMRNRRHRMRENDERSRVAAGGAIRTKGPQGQNQIIRER